MCISLKKWFKVKKLSKELRELGLHNNYEAQKIFENKYKEFSGKSISELKKEVSNISLAEFLLVAGFVAEKEDSLLALKIFSDVLSNKTVVSGALAEVSIFYSDIYTSQVKNLAKSRISYNLEKNNGYNAFFKEGLVLSKNKNNNRSYYGLLAKD